MSIVDSFSRIVAVVATIVPSAPPPVGLDRVTRKDSSPSGKLSSKMGTVHVADVCAAAKVIVEAVTA